MALGAYSFTDVVASVTGPGIATSIGASSGPTEEGISVEPKEDRNTMTFGADGSAMQTLHAAAPGRATIRLLKTSPINAVLSAAFAFQSASSANWGQNTVVITDVQRGDVITLSQAAFVRNTAPTYDKAGKFNEWMFEGVLDELLGIGLASA